RTLHVCVVALPTTSSVPLSLLFNAPATSEFYTLSLHDALPILHVNYQIPVLILEPAKHEYRAMTCVPGMEDLELFSPSASTRFPDRKSTRLNSSHVSISYAVFCLKKKKRQQTK